MERTHRRCVVRVLTSVFAVAATVAVIPEAGVARQDQVAQVVEGRVLPIRYASSHAIEDCQFEPHRKVMTPPSPLPHGDGEDPRNGTVGYLFDVDPETWNQPFELAATSQPGGDLAIEFAIRGEGETLENGYSTRGAERGYVPRGADDAIICVSDVPTEFRYAAGEGVRAPTVEDEAASANRSQNLELLQHTISNGGIRRIVFQDDLAIAAMNGANGGFDIYRILEGPPYLKLISNYNCPSAADGDLSVWGDFVYQSVQGDFPYASAGRRKNGVKTKVCNNTDRSRDQFGVRVVDISNLRRPRQAAFYRIPCGSMNNTITPVRQQLYLYSTIPCSDDVSVGEVRPLVPTIHVLRLDPKRPWVRETVGTPKLVRPDGMPQLGCHDLTVFPKKALAACPQFFGDAAGSALLDTSDPANPRVLGSLGGQRGVWASYAAFTWDGRYVVVADSDRASYEGKPTTICTGRPHDEQGALLIYDIRDPHNPKKVSHFSLPRTGNSLDGPCAPDEVTVIPTADPRRYVAVAGWRSGGLSVIDFTDPENPYELAHWQPPASSVTGGTYLYNGRLYSVEMWNGSGIRVFKLDGLGDGTTRSYRTRLNPQTQIADFR